MRNYRLVVSVAIAALVVLFFSFVDFRVVRSWRSTNSAVGYSTGGQPQTGMFETSAPIESVYLDADWANKDGLGPAFARALQTDGLANGPSRVDFVTDRAELAPGKPTLAIYSLELHWRYSPFYSLCQATAKIGYGADPSLLPTAPPDPAMADRAGKVGLALKGEISLEMKSAGLMTWPAYRNLVLQALAEQALAEIDKAWLAGHGAP